MGIGWESASEDPRLGRILVYMAIFVDLPVDGVID